MKSKTKTKPANKKNKTKPTVSLTERIAQLVKSTAETIIERIGLENHIDLTNLTQNVNAIEKRLRSLTPFKRSGRQTSKTTS